MSKSLKPDGVLVVLKEIGVKQLVPLSDPVLEPLMVAAEECGIPLEESESALDPTGKGADWRRALAGDMQKDPNLNKLVRAAFEPQIL